MAEIAGLMVRLEATTALLRNELKRAEGAVNNTANRIQNDANRAEDALSGIGSALKGGLAGLAAGLGADAFGQMIKSTLEFATNLKNVAAQSGLSTQALQQLNGAFLELGVGAGGFENALEEMLPNLGEALTGSGGAADAFRRLGVSLRDASGDVRSTDQILLSMADALKDVASPAERAGIAAAIFGEEAGPKMAQALSVGSARIRSLMGDVSTLSDEMINRAAEIDREWNKLASTVGTTLKSALLAFISDARQLGTDVGNLINSGKLTIEAATTPQESASLEVLHVQLEQLNADLEYWNELKANNQSGFFGDETGSVQRTIDETQKAIEKTKELIRTKQEAADQEAALRGLEREGIPSIFGNRLAEDQNFLRPGADGKVNLTPNDLRFGAATEKSFDELWQEREAKLKEMETLSEREAEAIRRVREELKHEADQLGRTKDEQELYNALKKAGVELGSPEAELIAADVKALQDRQRFMDFANATAEADLANLQTRKAILEAIATPTQKYNDELDRLNRLLNAGVISWEEWGLATSLAFRELQAGNKALEKTSTEMQFVQDSGERAFDRIGAGITNAFLSGEKAAVSFQNVTLAVISEILQSFIELAAINPIKNLLFGTANATLTGVSGKLAGSLAWGDTSGTFGGTGNGPAARASGGPVVAGQSYLVGEKRPEIFTPDVNGRILPRTPGLGSGPGRTTAGQVQLVQHLNFATGIQSTVRAEVMNMMPTISQTARMGMLEAQARRGRSL